MFGGDPFDPFSHRFYGPFDRFYPREYFSQMNRQMAEMDRMMSEPFAMMNRMNNMMNQMMGSMLGHPHHPMLGYDNAQRPSQRRSGNPSHRADPMDLDLFGGGFGFGGGLMQSMNNMMRHAENDPNSVVFSQSTMVAMGPDGTQRVVSNSTRKAGDVKETRHAVRDGEDERISVAHHIGDRAHVIEKKRDKDGRFRQQQKFVNLHEDEADQFNQEFKSRATRNLSGLFGGNPESDRRAIENGERHYRNAHRSSGHSSSNDRAQQSGSQAPIITIPDDDEEEDERPRGRRGTRNRYADDDDGYLRGSTNPRNGPTIRELSEEEAEAERSKRPRKGVFGRFFGVNDD